jgi:hypothetical protein
MGSSVTVARFYQHFNFSERLQAVLTFCHSISQLPVAVLPAVRHLDIADSPDDRAFAQGQGRRPDPMRIREPCDSISK